MNLLTRLLLGALPLAATAQAEVPVYRNQQLELPSAVVMTASGPVYYGDIRFTTNQDGSFTLTDAKRRNLAVVEETHLAVDTTTRQAEVSANGILSIACVALEEAAVVREGHTFHVVLAETTMEPDAVCMSLVAITEFEIDVPLDLNGLEPGEYTVDVNGVESVFVLTE